MICWKPLRFLQKPSRVIKSRRRVSVPPALSPHAFECDPVFDHDDGEQRLIVRFVIGLVYAYAGVPAEIAAGLREASSKGDYFTESIRDRFRFTQSWRS